MMPMYNSVENDFFRKSQIHVVDLRSDTVSKPSKEMRIAMMEADVGDDVYGEDPTVNRLEELAAEMFCKEAALFVPTGTMGNLIAILAHCDRRGCEVIMGDQSHTFLYEQGGPAQIGGVHTRTLPNQEDGTYSLSLLEKSIRADDVHSPITGLIIAENTHNMCGGKVVPMDWLNQLADLAKKYKIPLHMDGARIFNAAVYLKIHVSKITERFDSVQFCFSKGLGAPIGSMLVGPKAFINKGRRLRKVLGAGMRQVGVIAAPCIVALNCMIDRLSEDHRRTRELAQAIHSFNCDFIKVDLNGLHTNILMVHFNPKILSSTDFCTRLTTITETEKKELKNDCVLVRIFPKTEDVVRIVLYYEITDEDIRRVIKKLKYIIDERPSAKQKFLPATASVVADFSFDLKFIKMPSSVPSNVLSSVPDTHNLIKRQLNYSSVITTYVISVLAASLAEVVTYPLDLTKTRLQIQGEKTGALGRNVQYRGMFNTAVGVVREEGFLKLWNGITPALYRHVIYSGVRIVSYENIREKLLQNDPDRKFPLWKSAATGAASGAVAQFLASPADLVKVQIQMEGKRKLLGMEPRVRNTFHAFTKILKENGIRGLWKGSIPNVQRAALVNLGDLTTYDTAKRIILKNTGLTDNHVTHFLSSACAGLVAATMGTPADVVKTRIMNQPTDKFGRGLLYSSSVDCLKRTVKEEGVFALYKGFLPIWIRMAPWSLTFWLSFEQIRHTMGVTAF